MIALSHIDKEIGSTPVLTDVSFTAPAGKITAFLGPNGAGKTTTIRLIAGLLEPSAGKITVDGDRLGLLTEEPGLSDRLTVREQLRFVGAIHGQPAPVVDAAIVEFAALLAFDQHLDRRAGTLSKGTRQKVALARAFVADPDVLLLDEPTANLDPVASAAVETFLAAAGADRTVLLSTHLLDEAERLADHVVGINAGRVVIDCSVDAIREQATADGHRFRDVIVGAMARSAGRDL